MSFLHLLRTELSRAGQDARRLKLLADLETLRITPDKEIPPMQFLFRMFCKPCFPRGELVAITGKAKSGKTFVSSILMSLCFRQDVLSLQRLDPSPLRVLWFDTEQSEESTQDILNHRILPMIHDEGSQRSHPGLLPFLPGFHIFNVRSQLWQQRTPLLEAAMLQYQPDLVILDGIRDLVNDINDGILAQSVIEQLMHLAAETRSCLVCILHQNKSVEDKNLRGFLGTELRNKAFEVYECSKDQDRIFTWSQTDTRKYDIVDKLRFSVDDAGIPQLCCDGAPSEVKPATPSFTQDSRPEFNPAYVISREGRHVSIDVARLFTDAFRPGEILTHSMLQGRVMNMANITSYRYYNFRREEALQQGIIVQTHDDSGHICYSCPAKKAPDEPPF